jgi:protein MpaA
MDVGNFLEEFAAAAVCRGFSRVDLGEVGGWPLLAFGKVTPGKPVVYISAGMHGDEPAGPEALRKLLDAGEFDDRAGWWLCPVLNPWGLTNGHRGNADGYDLNRDYLSRVTREVALHAAWLDSLAPPELFLSLHEDWETSGFYLYEINTSEKESFASAVIEAVRPEFPPEPGLLIDDHAVTGPGWIFHPADSDFPGDWPEAIYVAKRGCPLSFTFETPSVMTWESRVAAHVLATRRAIGCWVETYCCQ